MRRPLAGIAVGPRRIPNLGNWVAPDTLKPGESLSDLFGRHGIGGVDKIQTSLSEALERAESTEPMAGDGRVRLAWDLADVMACSRRGDH